MKIVQENYSRVMDFMTSKKYINSFLGQEQTDSTMSNIEKTDTQNVSEETLLEQQFNDFFRIKSGYPGNVLLARRNVILSQKNTSF